MNAGIIVLIVMFAMLFMFLLTLFLLVPRKVYFGALFSGVYLPIFKIIGMKFRKLDVNNIVNAYILAKKSHLGITLCDFEVISTSGGHPLKIVEGLNASKNAKLNFDLEFVKALDVSGKNILDVIKECVNSKVIEIPLVTGVARDNIEVNAKISLTLKIDQKNFLTGVTEETISARAVEVVVTKISNVENASFLVSKPQLLDKAIFEAKIDEDSKYELVSADVIYVDYGKDRNLALEKEKIEKNRIMTANQLERRRLIALAEEQEMKIKVEEAKIGVVAQEAEVPKAIAKAIEEGKMKDVVDLYKLQNLQADTEMRRFLTGKSTKSDNQGE